MEKPTELKPGQVLSCYLIILPLVIYLMCPRTVVIKFGERQIPVNYSDEARDLLLLYAASAAVLLFFNLVVVKRGRHAIIDMGYMLAFQPLAFFLAVSTLITYTIMRLGQVPPPLHPPAASIGLSIPLFGICWVVFLACSLWAYLHFFPSIEVRWFLDKRAVLRSLLVCATTWTMFVIFLRNDPLGFINWLGD
jgi:hypothetical protein